MVSQTTFKAPGWPLQSIGMLVHTVAHREERWAHPSDDLKPVKGRETHKHVIPLIFTKEPNLNSPLSILVPLHLEGRRYRRITEITREVRTASGL